MCAYHAAGAEFHGIGWQPISPATRSNFETARASAGCTTTYPASTVVHSSCTRGRRRKAGRSALHGQRQQLAESLWAAFAYR